MVDAARGCHKSTCCRSSCDRNQTLSQRSRPHNCCRAGQRSRLFEERDYLYYNETVSPQSHATTTETGLNINTWEGMAREYKKKVVSVRACTLTTGKVSLGRQGTTHSNLAINIRWDAFVHFCEGRIQNFHYSYFWHLQISLMNKVQ